MSVPAEQSPHQIIWVAVSWAGIAIVGLNLPVTVIDVAGSRTAYVPWFAEIVCVLYAALWVSALVLILRRRRARKAMQATVILSLAVLALHPLTLRTGGSQYPPLLHLVGAGLCMSAVVHLRLATTLIVPAASAAVALIRIPELGVGRAWGEAALLAVSAWLATFAIRIVVRANDSVDDAVAAAARASERELRARRQTYERLRWNGLIHDKVLAALRAASRGAGDTIPRDAVALAATGLTALTGATQPRPGAMAAIWREHAERLGLEVAVDVTGDVPDPEVRLALRDATREALTNVQRHSGQRTAVLHGILTPTRATVTVTDPGRGFRVSETGHRAGIATSIVARMRAVGGHAHVRSTPQHGTEVRLDWSAAGPTADSQDWQLGLFAPIMVVGAIAFLLNVFLAIDQWRLSPAISLTVAATVVLAGLTVATTLLTPSDGNWVPLAVLAVVTIAALAGTIPQGAPESWRYWFLGALTPAVGAMAFRFRPWAGLALAGAATLVCMVADALAGRGVWQCLVGPVPVLITTAAAGQLVRTAFDSAYVRTAEAMAEDIQARLATAVSEERALEDDRRTEALQASIGPALQLIAGGGRLTPALRDQLADLESAARDQLAAPDLVDPALAATLARARARGIRIDIVDTSPTDAVTGGDESLDLCRRLVADLVEGVPPHTRVRINWHAGSGGAGATFSATTRDLLDKTPDLAQALADLGGRQARVSTDSDSILIRCETPAKQARPRERSLATVPTDARYLGRHARLR